MNLPDSLRGAEKSEGIIPAVFALAAAMKPIIKNGIISLSFIPPPAEFFFRYSMEKKIHKGIMKVVLVSFTTVA